MLLVAAATAGLAQTDSCVITSVPQTWGFESGNTGGTSSRPLPQCWTRISSIGTPYVDTYNPIDPGSPNYTAHTGSCYLRFYDNVQAISTLVLPAIDPNSLSIQELQVSFYLKTLNAHVEDVLEVGVMIDPTDTSTFTVLHTIHAYGWDYYNPFELPLSDYTGTGLHIALRSKAKTDWSTSILIDDLTLDVRSACPRPSNLTYDWSTDTSAHITWTGFDSQFTDFTIWYKLMDDSVWSSQSFTSDTCGYTLTGLTPSSTYQAYIVSDCRPNDPSGDVWFNTACGPITSVPQFWDLESGYSYYPDFGFLVYCWNLDEAEVEDYASEAHSGDMYLLMYSSGPTLSGNEPYNSTIMLPEIDTSLLNINDLQLSFYARSFYNGQDGDGEVQVGVMTDPSDDSTFTPLAHIATINANWQSFTVPLSSYTGSGTWIALRWENLEQTPNYLANYVDLSIDDVTLEAIPACPPPSALTVDSATADAVTFSWLGFNANNSDYLVYYKPCDESVWDSVSVTVSSPTYTISGLMPTTLYHIYVRPLCDTALESEILIAGTGCASIETVPQIWDFEAAESMPLPHCWTRHDNTDDTYPVVIDIVAQAQSGSHCVQFHPSQYSVVVLPKLDFYILDINQLQFSFSLRAASNTSNAGIYIGMLTDPQDMSTFDTMLHIPQLTTQYQTFDIPLSDYSGGGTYLAVMSAGNVGVYMDNVSIDSLSGCQRPSNLTVSDITIESAVFQWIGYNPAQSNYTLYYRETDSFVWTTVPISVSDATYTLIGLLPSTTYIAYLAPACDPAKMSNSVTFKTGCGVWSLPQTWNFEDVDIIYDPQPNPLSECWSRVSGVDPYVLWHWSSGFAHSGLKALRFSPQTYAIGILPFIDTNYLSINEMQISFYARYEGYDDGSSLTVGVMTDPTDSTTFTAVGEIPIVTTDYQRYELPLHAFTGYGAYIALKRTNPDDWSYIHVDDLTLDTLPDCVAPASLTVGNITSTTVQLTWSHPVDSVPFIVHYRLSGATAWLTETTAAGLSHTLTGLLEGRDYEAYVSPICSDTAASYPITFTTACIIIDSLPRFWDFESDNLGGTAANPLPRCWTCVVSPQSSNPPSIKTHSYASPSGTHTLDFNQSSGSYLVLPMVDVSALPINTLQLSFDMRVYTGTLHNIEVGVMVDPTDTTTFVPVQSFNNLSGSWESLTVSFAGYAGAGAYIAFRDACLSSYHDIRIDDLTLQQMPGCDAPANLSVVVVAGRSATLSWSHNADSFPYLVYYRDALDGAVWEVDTAVAADTAGFVLEGLEPMHSYTVFVMAGCTPPSLPSNTVQFTTTCAEDIIAVPQSWYFEASDCGTGDLPYCWQFIDVYGYAYPRMLDAFGGGGQCLNFYNAPGNMAVLPYINDNYLDIRDLEMSFSIKDFYAAGNGAVDVGVMSDPTDTSTFTLVQTVDGLDGNFQQVVVSFAGYTGTGTYIALRDGSWPAGFHTYDVYVDTLVLYLAAPVEPCEAPTDLQQVIAAKEVGDIHVTWTDNAGVSQWNLQYRPLSGDWTTVVVTGMPQYDITGLVSGEDYEVRVQAVCDDNVSEWSAILTATATNIGLDSWLAAGVTLFPNPAREYVDVRVDGDVRVTAMEVYDVYGKVVCTVVGANQYSPQQTRINVAGLSAGIYFVHVAMDCGEVTKRFVKQ